MKLWETSGRTTKGQIYLELNTKHGQGLKQAFTKIYAHLS